MSHFGDEAIEKAADHHWRWCERNGVVPDQPSASSSERVGNVVQLRNVNGPLASYRVRSDGRVIRIEG
jgi:predicted ArsR family transcriptional regulator